MNLDTSLSFLDVLIAIASLVSGGAGGTFLGAVARGRHVARDRIRTELFPVMAAEHLAMLEEGSNQPDVHVRLELESLLLGLPYTDRVFYKRYASAAQKAIEAGGDDATRSELDKTTKAFRRFLVDRVNPSFLSPIRNRWRSFQAWTNRVTKTTDASISENVPTQLAVLREFRDRETVDC